MSQFMGNVTGFITDTAAVNGSSSEQSIVGIKWDDATWILTSAFIIFTMQSGFGLLESGSASSKNEVNIMVKNAVDVVFGGISYWMFGFGFSCWVEGESNQFCGVSHFFFNPDTEFVERGRLFSLFFFKTSFATTATTIVSGAMAERTKLEAYILFSFCNTFIYCFPSHWMWDSEESWFRQLGATDIAGASTVHLVGGVTGLVATLMLGPRTGRFDETSTASKMGSPTNAILGLFMLWWGWLGYNCGSTYGIANKKWILATRSAVATITSSIGGGMTGITLSYITKKRKFDIVYIIHGVLGALVSITAFCALARPWEGLVIGAVGGGITCLSVPFIERLLIDDPVGVIPVHLVAAVWGMLSVGVFGKVEELDDHLRYPGLLGGGGFKLLGVQLAVVVVIILWTSVVSYVILKVIDLTIGLRVPLHEELLGADLVEHSVNGSFDRSTGNWYDVTGRSIMVIDTSTEDEYERSIYILRLKLYNEIINAAHLGGRRHSAFGFSRTPSRSSCRHSRKSKMPTHLMLENSRRDSFTELGTISLNGINHESPQRREGARTVVPLEDVEEENLTEGHLSNPVAKISHCAEVRDEIL